jgi:hypothetical protein
MQRLLISIGVAIGLQACAMGAPPGFSSGNHWEFPLVGPLEEGVLLTPVMINDKGPFLMLIDPDAPRSIVDEGIVSQLDLYGGIGPKVLDESDTHRSSRMAEVRSFQLGNLTVRRRDVFVSKVGAFNVSGRQVRGVIGRDIISDSLVFSFDRSLGVGYLSTQDGFVAPANARRLSYHLLSNRLPEAVSPVSRRVAKVSIGGAAMLLHIDLGAATSQLRPGRWSAAKLTPVPVATTLVDEVGTARRAERSGVAAVVSGGGILANHLRFAPYDDRRWDELDIDGTVGLAFFRGYNVFASWDQQVIYAVPRAGAVTATHARIARWKSSVVAACAHRGCVDVQVESEGDSVKVAVQRDVSAAQINLELLLLTVPAQGVGIAPDLAPIVVNLPAGVDRVEGLLDSSYQGLLLQVADLSPFPRTCPSEAGCMYAADFAR